MAKSRGRRRPWRTEFDGKKLVRSSDLPLYLANGVTTVRNMRGTPAHVTKKGNRRTDGRKGIQLRLVRTRFILSLLKVRPNGLCAGP